MTIAIDGRWAIALVPAVMLAACGAGAQADASRADLARGDSARAVGDTAPVGDSLALALPDGASLRFTSPRAARDSTGRACVERSLALERHGRRHIVPLLYTAEAPTRVDDTTARVHLWGDCRPGDLYEIDLRTAQPRRVTR